MAIFHMEIGLFRHLKQNKQKKKEVNSLSKNSFWFLPWLTNSNYMQLLRVEIYLQIFKY